MISGLRPLSPLWCLRHHLSPAKAGALWILSNVPHSSEGNRRANLPLRGRRRRRRQKGCISIARRAVCLFSTGEARLYGFAAGRRHTKWRRKALYLPSGAVLYNSLGRQALKPSGRRSRSRTEPLAPRGVSPGGAINPRPEGPSTFGNTVRTGFSQKPTASGAAADRRHT